MANNDAQKEIHIAGDSPLPNVVDSYSSYTYNITFSMLPQSFWFSGILPIGKNQVNKMIIAQTGVTTKFNIDNLTIQTVADNYGSTFTSSLGYTTKATFEITEPLGSSLVTLMHEGFNQLKKLDAQLGNDSDQLYNKKESMGPLDLMYLLEVDLIGHRGYKDSGTELFDELGPFIGTGDGGSAEIFGKYAWPVFLTQFDFNPDNEGTRYNFEVVSTQNFIKKLPTQTRKIDSEFEITAHNIPSFLSQLSKKVNADILASQQQLHGGDRSSPKNSHSISIKRGKQYFSKDNKEGSQDWHEPTEGIDPVHFTEKVTIKLPPAQEASDQGTGAQEDTVDAAKLKFSKGESIKDAIIKILKLNSNFCTFVSNRKFKMDEPNTTGEPKDPEKDLTYSINFHKTLTAKGDPAPTGGPAFNIVYSIDLKAQAGVQQEPGKDETKEKQKTIVEKWGIVKKYDYIFSGLNDQVLDVDLSFPQGQVFLFPEAGGLTPTYRDSKAKVNDPKNLEDQKGKDKKNLLATNNPDIILQHFEKLQSDLKGAVSQITEDGKDFLQGLKTQAALAKDPAGALKNLNGRLPSSPATVFHKIKAIESTTQFFDGLYQDVVDFQESLEDAAEDFVGGIDLQGKIAGLVKDAVQPFEFVTEFRKGISGKLEQFSGGIDGFAESLGLDASAIPGLGEIQGVVDSLDDLISSAGGGFSPGSIGGGSFELLTQESSESGNSYLEELDFSSTGRFEDAEFIEKDAQGQAVSPDKEDTSVIPAQHYMSTALSYSKTGIPYLVRLGLEVKGDPYWIGSQNYVTEINKGEPITLIDASGDQKRWKPEFVADRTNTDSAPYDSGSIFLAFRYLFPKEYEHYQEDPDDHTGIMRFGGMDLSYSGYYMVVKIQHRFAEGKFLQNIDAVKMTTHPNKVIFSDKSNIEEESAETTQPKNVTNESNTAVAGNDITTSNSSEEVKQGEYRGTATGPGEERLNYNNTQDFLQQNGYISGPAPSMGDFDPSAVDLSQYQNITVDYEPFDIGAFDASEIVISDPFKSSGGGG